METNRFYIVGDRPVKYIIDPDGGAGIYAFDWKTGDFTLAMFYLSRFRGSMDDVESVTEKEFEEYVMKLRMKRVFSKFGP